MNHDAYTDAASAILTELCAATGLEPGAGGYLFFLPPQANVFALYLSEGGDSSELAQCPITHLRMDALVEGRFAAPDEAMRFVMRVLEIVPKDDFATVQRLHLTATPTVVADVFTLANQNDPSITYLAKIQMEAIINCT